MHLPQHTPSLSAIGLPNPDAGRMLGPSDDSGHPPIASLYIHTPFCVHKCHYCDFYSFVDTRDQQTAFVDRLMKELESLAPHAGPLRTIFVGGGTPSLLRLDLWERVLAALDRLYDLSPIRTGERDHLGLAEFTVECNPESATPELMTLLRSGGVNRVSVGAQSFFPKHLKTLERTHNQENVPRAIDAARAAGIQRQSVDLIFAIPGQTLDEWDSDLRRAIAIGTTHISCYNLTYEPNTAMTKRLSLGEFTPCPDELEEQMFEHTVRVLREHGLQRYEVSNFARPGDESRHNIAYWVQEQWLAAGPSASGHCWAGPTMRSGSKRWKNVPRLGDYLDSHSSGFSPVVDVEDAEPLRLVRERIMMGLRLARGMDSRTLLDDLGSLSPGSVGPIHTRIEDLAARGLVVDEHDRWLLTDNGFLLCDWIASELMQCVRG